MPYFNKTVVRKDPLFVLTLRPLSVGSWGLELTQDDVRDQTVARFSNWSVSAEALCTLEIGEARKGRWSYVLCCLNSAGRLETRIEEVNGAFEIVGENDASHVQPISRSIKLADELYLRFFEFDWSDSIILKPVNQIVYCPVGCVSLQSFRVNVDVSKCPRFFLRWAEAPNYLNLYVSWHPRLRRSERHEQIAHLDKSQLIDLTHIPVSGGHYSEFLYISVGTESCGFATAKVRIAHSSAEYRQLCATLGLAVPAEHCEVSAKDFGVELVDESIYYVYPTQQLSLRWACDKTKVSFVSFFIRNFPRLLSPPDHVAGHG